MPRRSSGGRPAPCSAPCAAPNPPQPVGHAPPPFLKKASEKMVMKKNFTVFKEEIRAKAKKNILKVSGTRKGLADISNSIRHPTSKKKQNTEKCIAYEEFYFHDRQACIKAQQCKAMDMDEFLETLGLTNGCPKELPSLKRPETPPRSPPPSPPPIPPLSPPSPPRLLEMPEEPISDRSAEKFDYSLPAPNYEFWKYCEDLYDFTDIKLLDSPKLGKH